VRGTLRKTDPRRDGLSQTPRRHPYRPGCASARRLPALCGHRSRWASRWAAGFTSMWD